MNEWEKHREEANRQRGYSESYLSAIKRWLNLQTIGAYIREGSNKTIIDNDSFQKREASAFSTLEELLTEKYGKDETDEIISHINAYIVVIQEIYFSLGMKAGATLHCKLTDNFETDI